MVRATTILLTAAISLVLSMPPLVSACTGCPTKFGEFVRGADRIVLARYVGESAGRYEYHVIDVLKGGSPRTLRFQYDPVGPPAPPIGSHWLISTEVPPDGILRASAVFQVSGDGSVTPTDEGEGAVEAPDTLTGWYAAITRLPDTATAAAARDSGGVPELMAFLFVMAVLGAVAMLRRLACHRSDPGSPPIGGLLRTLGSQRSIGRRRPAFVDRRARSDFESRWRATLPNPDSREDG